MKASRRGSIRSVKSSRSMKSNLSFSHEDLAANFETLLPLICERFPKEISRPVIVNKDYRRDDYLQSLKEEEVVKYKKITVKSPILPSKIDVEKLDDNPTTDTGTEAEVTTKESSIVVTTLYDNMKRLVEIAIDKMKVPRALIQIIGCIAPSYGLLAKFSIRSCRINVYTIHELAKMLPLSTITEICLDGSSVPEGNYDILLGTKFVHLKNISLSRCYINDEICKAIASKIHNLCPAEKSLLVLNLSSNHITDTGAKHLGEALRTNRHLRYLNLADNRIGDVGAAYIFNALKDFVLSYDENINRRKRYIDYLKTREAIFLKCLEEIYNDTSNDEHSQNSKKTTSNRKKNSATSLKTKASSKRAIKKEKTYHNMEQSKCKAEMIARELIGPFWDPFSIDSVKIKDGQNYCIGNMVLCYLNLSYNNLSYLSVNKLLDVLQNQTAARKLNQTGLLKVILDGNYMPINCDEYDSIVELINKNVSQCGGKMFSEFGRKKSRTGGRISIALDRNTPLGK